MWICTVLISKKVDLLGLKAWPWCLGLEEPLWHVNTFTLTCTHQDATVLHVHLHSHPISLSSATESLLSRTLHAKFTWTQVCTNTQFMPRYLKFTYTPSMLRYLKFTCTWTRVWCYASHEFLCPAVCSNRKETPGRCIRMKQTWDFYDAGRSTNKNREKP